MSTRTQMAAHAWQGPSFDGYEVTHRSLNWNPSGRLTEATSEPTSLGNAERIAIPASVNAHSHAFQRVIRGKTHRAGPSNDSFWTWRDAMYKAVQALSPDDVFVAARQLYLECALSGCTTVGEFHYLHHARDGSRYPVPHLMADACLRAAQEVGIRLVMLFGVYLRGGFGVAATENQRRFVDADVEAALERVDAFQAEHPECPIGLSLHSVRAVPVSAMKNAMNACPNIPIHIHVSEQRAEVKACKKETGHTPVSWLAHNDILSKRVTLVHATHVDTQECDLIAKSKATVCLCPTTEANLGDGLAPVTEFARRDIPMCVGSDDQTTTWMWGEAGRIELQERLHMEARNCTSDEPGAPSTDRPWRAATTDGAASLGLQLQPFVSGHPADFVEIDLTHPTLLGSDADTLAANLMFSANSGIIRNVWCDGQPIVREGQHTVREESQRDFRALLDRL